eukprot:15921889-Heterocapsa_arctica.AAC.1
MIPVDRENVAYASAFELYLEYGNDLHSNIFDRQLQNEVQHHSEHPGTWTCFQTTATPGALGFAGH